MGLFFLTASKGRVGSTWNMALDVHFLSPLGKVIALKA